MVRAGGHADPADHGRLQLRPALAAPVVAGELVGLVRACQADDPATELVGTAYGGLDRGPALAKLVVA